MPNLHPTPRQHHLAHSVQRGLQGFGAAMDRTRHPNPLIGRVKVLAEIHPAHRLAVAQDLSVIRKPLPANGDCPMRPHSAHPAARCAILKPTKGATHVR